MNIGERRPGKDAGNGQNAEEGWFTQETKSHLQINFIKIIQCKIVFKQIGKRKDRVGRQIKMINWAFLSCLRCLVLKQASQSQPEEFNFR